MVGYRSSARSRDTDPIMGMDRRPWNGAERSRESARAVAVFGQAGRQPWCSTPAAQLSISSIGVDLSLPLPFALVFPFPLSSSIPPSSFPLSTPFFPLLLRPGAAAAPATARRPHRPVLLAAFYASRARPPRLLGLRPGQSRGGRGRA